MMLLNYIIRILMIIISIVLGAFIIIIAYAPTAVGNETQTQSTLL